MVVPTKKYEIFKAVQQLRIETGLNIGTWAFYASRVYMGYVSDDGCIIKLRMTLNDFVHTIGVNTPIS